MAQANIELMIRDAQSCSGSVKISGSKNAALPELAACLLTNQKVTLHNVPKITDIDLMKTQLQSYGVRILSDNGSTLVLQADNPWSQPTSDAGSKTRGAFLVLGPLLARCREGKVYLPGGCQIVRGGRPVDYHIKALEEMGAEDESSGRYVELKAETLYGAQIQFEQISVTATENIVMAACLAVGRTVITNAAVEPEVIDLVEMLNDMGANIEVYKSENMIIIDGNSGYLLNGCTHTVIPDRIEAGTFAIAAAITGGSLLLKMDPTTGSQIMANVLERLQKAGVSVEWRTNGLQVQRLGPISPVDITTGAFPLFPTDLLPQWVTFMTLANGPSIIIDTIYDNRFGHVSELEKMGARFTKFSDKEYKVHGNAALKGKRVQAKDLRGGAALILAALAANGTTIISGFQHVLRGYEDIKNKLKQWRVSFHKLPETRRGFHGGQHPYHER